MNARPEFPTGSADPRWRKRVNATARGERSTEARRGAESNHDPRSLVCVLTTATKRDGSSQRSRRANLNARRAHRRFARANAAKWSARACTMRRRRLALTKRGRACAR
jgi:uncharacterized MAPEG superfamily protein